MAVTINGTTGITGNSGTLISASTIGVGGATPAASGAGITFPATQSASSDANTLDDYEEGSWTLTLTPVTSGSITVNSSYNTGYYTKIGRQVFIHLYFVVSSVSSPVGRLRINGLPFTINANSPFSGTAYLLTTNAFTGVPWTLGSAGGTTSFIDRNAGTGADPAVDLASAIKANTEGYFSCTYYV